jgi:Transcriptional regulator, AbiEi antitoxin
MIGPQTARRRSLAEAGRRHACTVLTLRMLRRQQFGVFTSAQAHECGLSRHQIQGGLRSGHLVALRRGVYVESREYDAASPAERSKARAVAACLARPRSVVSHHSAAVVHALPLLGSRPAVPALTFPADVGRHADTDRSVIVRACVLPRWQTECRGTWRVTSAARTVCDVAREGELTYTVALADCALFRGLTTLAELCAVRESCSTWPGSDRLRHLLRLADDRSESPYESIARYQLIRSGFEWSLRCGRTTRWDRSGVVTCGCPSCGPSWRLTATSSISSSARRACCLMRSSDRNASRMPGSASPERLLGPRRTVT